MANLISVKIDVKKLDKSRFFQGKPDANGHAPLYCDLVILARKEVGKYGDTHIVKQSKKKDEQVELPIIGSATERTIKPAYTPPPQTGNQTGTIDDNSDVPF